MWKQAQKGQVYYILQQNQNTVKYYTVFKIHSKRRI